MPSIFKETGKTGLRHSYGYILEEDLPELQGERWRRLVKEMLNDPVVAAFLFAIEMLVRQVEWSIAPASQDNRDKENADFIDGALLKDMSQPWAETLAEILSCVPWGWSWLEIVYKRRQGATKNPALRSQYNDGKIGWRKFAIRSQDSLWSWDLDDAGGVSGMIQSPPPTYETLYLPIEKSLLFRTTSHKGNPEGVSLLRKVYRAYYFKHRIENLEGIGIERDLAGLPKVSLPSRYMEENATNDEKAVYELAKTIATNIRRDEEGGLVWPSDCDEHGNKLFDIELLTTGGERTMDTDKIINRWDQRILMIMMADFLMLGHEKVGSFALSSDKSELFGVALGALLDSICGVINRHAIPKLQRLNGRGDDAFPTLMHSSIEKVDLGVLGTFIVNLASGGITLNPEQKQWALKQGGFPISEEGAGGDPKAEPDKNNADDSAPDSKKDATEDDPANDQASDEGAD